jgi:hypothetical protein
MGPIAWSLRHVAAVAGFQALVHLRQGLLEQLGELVLHLLHALAEAQYLPPHTHSAAAVSYPSIAQVHAITQLLIGMTGAYPCRTIHVNRGDSPRAVSEGNPQFDPS